MSSARGAEWAQIEVGFGNDLKFLKLARRQKDQVRTFAALGVYVVSVLASWENDEPVAAADAAPGWAVDDIDDLVADLRAVGLLDGAGAVPEHALDERMAGFRGRRDRARDAANIRWQSERNAAAVQSRVERVDKKRARETPTNGVVKPQPIAPLVDDIAEALGVKR